MKEKLRKGKRRTGKPEMDTRFRVAEEALTSRGRDMERHNHISARFYTAHLHADLAPHVEKLKSELHRNQRWTCYAKVTTPAGRGLMDGRLGLMLKGGDVK